MKIVIAPDSFKGSIHASRLCRTIKRGIQSMIPEADILALPLADGGEGTVESLVKATNGTFFTVEVLDPLMRPIMATYGVLGDKTTAVIEMAQASGLPLLRKDERNPLITSSYGTGQLIVHALEQGYRKFIIGLGGSSTNDGGTGMLRALGVRFLDKDSVPLPEGGAALRFLDTIDSSSIDPRLKEAEFIIASDVTNPLSGPNGASVVFGPQKGATPEMVEELDRSLKRYAEVIKSSSNIDVEKIPGSGAAGGMGAAFLAFLNGEFKAGIDVVMETIGFREKIKDANWIITGEGRLDKQTLSGKVIAGVCRIAKKANIPVLALCGEKNIDAKDIDELGLVAAFSIVPGPCTLETAIKNTEDWVEREAENLGRMIHYMHKGGEKNES